MKRADSTILSHWILIVLLGCLTGGCATAGEELRTARKTEVYPATQINLEKVYAENRGLIILEENATMIHDCYRGGVQRKEEGERLMKDGRWEEARVQFGKSNRYLRTVLKHLPEDEAHRTLYGGQKAIFLPNLLIADNDLKLIVIYRTLGKEDKASEARSEGQLYLGESLKTVRTEWGDAIKQGFEDELKRK